MRVILFLLYASLLFGQLDNNSVTITASRSITSQPDQAIFNITAATPLTATIDDAIAALPGLGLTASQLTGVQAANQALDWSFTLSVPLAKLKDTVATLTALQQSLSKIGNSPVLDFTVGGTSSTPAQCSKSDLVADATALAQKLTAAAGMALGPIVAVSDTAQGTTYPVIAAINGDFSALTGSYAGLLLVGGISSTPIVSPAPATTCSLTVKFGMSRY